MPAYRLRPSSAGDEAFLFELFAANRRASFATLGWPEAALQTLLRQQWAAQCAGHRARFETAQDCIVQWHGSDAGRLLVDATADALHLVDIALLPPHCGQGLGTALLRDLQARAAASDQALTLQVDPLNPALRLYQRLGFEVLAGDGLSLPMRWSPGPRSTPGPRFGA